MFDATASEPVKKPVLATMLTADSPDLKFAIDETVRVKTGGPEMLVDEIVDVRGQLRYRCYWVEGESGRVATYTAEQLERLNDNGPDETLDDAA